MLVRTTWILLVASLLSTIVAVQADLSGYFSGNDASQLRKLSQRIASNTSSTGRDIFFALQLAGMSQSIDKLCKCDLLTEKLRSPRSPIDAYYLTQAGDLCNCGLKLPKAISQALSDALQSDDVTTVAAALLLARKFKTLSAEGEEAVFNHLKELALIDGELNISFSDVSSSTAKIHIILETLLALKDEPFAGQFTTDVAEKVFQFIPGGDGDSLSDATFIYPLSSLSAKKLRIEKTGLKASAEQLLSLKYSDDAHTLYLAYKSLEILRSYKAAPYYLAIETVQFTHGQTAKHLLSVIAYDLLGEAQTIEEVELVSLKVIGKDSFLLQNVKQTGATISFASENLPAGRYGVNLAVTLKEKAVTARFQSVITVTEPAAQISAVHAGLSDSKTAVSSDLAELKTQNSLTDLTASALALDFFHVMYQVQATRKPHQSMLRLTHTESGRTVVFNAARLTDGSSTTEYHATVAFADEAEAFSHESGNYVVSILIGDATFASPLEWIVGSIEIKFPPKSAVNLPLYAKSLLYTSDTTLQALPEIAHVMRPPARRASNFMAGVFTLLTLAPLAIFILFNFSLGPNLARMKSLSAAAFVVCLVAIVLLFAGYWLALDGVTFYDTIKYLCILFPLTIFIGRYALSSVAIVRQDETKTK